jgi:hypothetical protein
MTTVTATASRDGGASASPSDTITSHRSTGAHACLQHGAGEGPATTDRAGPTRREPAVHGRSGRRDRPGHHAHHACCLRCPTTVSPWTPHGPSARFPSTASSPRPGSATRSSSSARRCTASPPRSTSSGLGSVVGRQRPAAPRAASPASRSAPGRGLRAREASAARHRAVPGRSGRRRPAPVVGARAVPSAPRAPSAAPAGPSRRPGRVARGQLRAGRVAEPDGYPHRRA